MIINNTICKRNPLSRDSESQNNDTDNGQGLISRLASNCLPPASWQRYFFIRALPVSLGTLALIGASLQLAVWTFRYILPAVGHASIQLLVGDETHELSHISLPANANFLDLFTGIAMTLVLSITAIFTAIFLTDSFKSWQQQELSDLENQKAIQTAVTNRNN